MENRIVDYKAKPIVTVLFQGDSITEAFRNPMKEEDLGMGYAMMIAKRFSTENNGKKVRFLNHGIGGDRVKDLKKRWEKDCLNVKPDIVSILVGINDIVGRHFWSKPTSTESFEEDYRILLQQTRDILGAKIVLLSPFMVCMTKLQLVHKTILKQKINVVIELSREFETLLVPLDRIFEEATRKKAPTYWSIDGIHPTSIGHSLIAESWLKSMSEVLF